MGIVTKGVGKKQEVGCIWNSIQLLSEIAVAIRSSAQCLTQDRRKLAKDVSVSILKP